MKKLLSAVLATLLLSNVAIAKDERTVIVVTAEERNALLSEMRHMLKSSQQILEGVSNDDMDMVFKAAKASGMKMGRATPTSLKQKLPAGFRAIGPKSHMGFEKIATEADGFGDSKKIISILSETQKACIACHQAYQIQVGK